MAIKSGTQRPVTLQDIADCCKVHKGTVSRVLSNSGHRIGPETIELVRTTAKEMGYDPACHQVARRLALSKSGRNVINQTIALDFNPDYQHYNYFYAVLRGIVETVASRGYTLVTTTYDSTHETPIPPAVVRGDVDGIITMIYASETENLVKLLRSEANFGDRPILSLVEPVKDCSNVLTDDFGGGYEETKYLLELGHRHIIHFCVDQTMFPHMERLRGHTKACVDFGVSASDCLYPVSWTTDPENRHEHVTPEDVVLKALGDYPLTTAILGRNDLIASDVMRVLRMSGMSVPKDMSVVGFDDSDPFVVDEFGNNMLTTVRLPLIEVGRTAAGLLIDRITGKEPQDKTVFLPTQLILRSSTAPPRQSGAKLRF